MKFVGILMIVSSKQTIPVRRNDIYDHIRASKSNTHSLSFKTVMQEVCQVSSESGQEEIYGR